MIPCASVATRLVPVGRNTGGHHPFRWWRSNRQSPFPFLSSPVPARSSVRPPGNGFSVCPELVPFLVDMAIANWHHCDGKGTDMARKKPTAQAELPRLHYVRRLWGRKIIVPIWPEDRAVDRVEVDGHILEVWHLSRLDWYEVRIDGAQAHVAGHLIDVAREWRDNCLEWK